MTTIVLVENRELLYLLNESFFHRDGVVFITVKGGRELQEVIGEHTPDLIFLNTELPDMSGAACCLALKSHERFRHVPVVMVVPASRPHEVEVGRRVGCDDVLLSPFGREAVVTKTRSFIPMRERALRRFPIRLDVRYGTDPHRLRTGTMANLNHNGLFLESIDSLPKDSFLTLEFTLPGSERQMRCTARVAWISHCSLGKTRILAEGMGLQFVDLPETDRKYIREYLQKAEQAVSNA